MPVSLPHGRKTIVHCETEIGTVTPSSSCPSASPLMPSASGIRVVSNPALADVATRLWPLLENQLVDFRQLMIVAPAETARAIR